MVAYNKFNQFVQDLGIANINLNSDTFKVMLTNTAPVATNHYYSDISANDLSTANGYTAGGTAATITSWTNSSGTSKWILQQVVFTATGAVGPFRYAALYDSTPASNKTLIAWWDYGSSVTLANGDTFTVAFDGTNGVFTIA